MTVSTSLLTFEELFTELHHAIAKREQNLVLLKAPLDSIEIGCYFRIGRILPKTRF
jgi:hypothetical protein